MDASRRKELEKFALERVDATADDHDRWSYAWGRNGSVCLSYCMWSEHEEFDGDTNGLENLWSKDRLGLIDAGDAEPDEDELRQWRDVMCRRTADAGEGHVVWIVPVTEDRPYEAFAVFLWHSGGASGDPPELYGVFAALETEGVISKSNPSVKGFGLP